MSSKYAKVIQSLEKIPTEIMEGGSDYQHEVNMIKRTIENKQPASLAAAWVAIRNKKEELKQREKQINLQLRAYEQLLEEAYEEEDIETISLANIGTIAMRPDPYVRVSNPEAYRQHCIDSGLLPLMSIPYQTTKSNARELLLQGEELPPGVEIYAKWSFSLRRAK